MSKNFCYISELNSPAESGVKVDYIQAVLPEDEKTTRVNGDVAYSYQIGDSSESIDEPFVFTVVTDSHLGTDKHCEPELYEQTMKNLALDRPLLHFDLGDTFRSSKVVDPDYEKIENLYIAQKPFFDYAAQSAQIYLVIGNHELEYGYLLDGTENNIPK